MGEADWWLCGECLSLNNLAAGKCYSCKRKRPQDAVRASERLGYMPVETWDGKVTLQQRDPYEALERERKASELRPLRAPVRRDTLAVAPRPPHPARITYHHVQAPPASGGPGTAITGPGPVVAVGPGAPGPPGAGSADTSAAGAPPWPHWQELLDGPQPDGQRLRHTTRPVTGADAGDEFAPARRTDLPLRDAINVARTTRAQASGTYIPWPEADRPMSSSSTEADGSWRDDAPARSARTTR